MGLGIYKYRTGWEAGFAQENPTFPREELFIHDTKHLRAGEEERERGRERGERGDDRRGRESLIF